MLLLFARIIGALSAYGKPGRIAFAMAMGMVLAIVPGGTVLWFLVFIPMMLVRINQAAMVGMMAAARLAAPIFDRHVEALGYALLTHPNLEGPMAALLSVPGLPFLRLDHSLIFGSVVVAIIGFPAYFAISRLIIWLYRRYLAAPVRRVFRSIGAKLPWVRRLSGAIGSVRRLGGAA